MQSKSKTGRFLYKTLSIVAQAVDNLPKDSFKTNPLGKNRYSAYVTNIQPHEVYGHMPLKIRSYEYGTFYVYLSEYGSIHHPVSEGPAILFEDGSRLFMEASRFANSPSGFCFLSVNGEVLTDQETTEAYRYLLIP